jgi:hypothetical protein
MLTSYLLQLQQQEEERRSLGWSLDAQHRPQAMSSPHDATSRVADSNNFLPAVPEHRQLGDAMLDIVHDQRQLVRPHTLPDTSARFHP